MRLRVSRPSHTRVDESENKPGSSVQEFQAPAPQDKTPICLRASFYHDLNSPLDVG